MSPRSNHPTFVVFDTNIWLSDLALRSGAGSAARFYVRSNGYVAAVPEVVRLEVEKHLLVHLMELSETIRDAHQTLLKLFGRTKEIVLPTEEEMRSKANGAINDALREIDRRDIPFTLESARSSLEKILLEAPPNKKGHQQFKDGAIWADCIRLLDEGNVYFVSSDGDFYQDRKVKNGCLDSGLQAEADGRAGKLWLVSSLKDLLPRIETPLQLNENAIAQDALAAVRSSMDTFLEARGLELTDRLPGTVIDMAATEEPSRLYGSGLFRYGAQAAGNRERDALGAEPLWLSATVEQEVTFDYDVDAGRVSRIHPGTISLRTRLPDGDERCARIHFASAHGVIGHRDVLDIVRYPIGTIGQRQ